MNEAATAGGLSEHTLQVLLIEDDLPQRILATELLGDEGFKVHSAATLYDGLEMLALPNARFDVVVLDLDLPDSSGVDSLSNALHGCDAPVIVYSGSEDPEMSRQSRIMGARAFVPKSPTVEVLAAAIRRVVDEGAGWTARPPITSLEITGSAGLTDAIMHTLEFLAKTLPMGKWMFTRVTGDDWIVLAVEGDEYDEIDVGTSTRWSESYCSRMLQGAGPMVVNDTATEQAYVAAPINDDFQIGAYCAAPIVHSSHGVFGTLCGISTQPVEMIQEAAESTVSYAAAMLASTLAADLDRDRLQRRFNLAKVASRVDQLTGLGNRRAFDMMCKVEHARAERYGFRTAIAVVDLDGLKAVNDEHGHLEGDRLITRAADALSTVTRDSDIAFRIGGDEFVVIAPQCDPARLQILTARVAEALDHAGVSGSVGSSCQRRHGEPLAEVLRRADESMYAAKQAKAPPQTTAPAADG